MGCGPGLIPAREPFRVKASHCQAALGRLRVTRSPEAVTITAITANLCGSIPAAATVPDLPRPSPDHTGPIFLPHQGLMGKGFHATQGSVAAAEISWRGLLRGTRDARGPATKPGSGSGEYGDCQGSIWPATSAPRRPDQLFGRLALNAQPKGVHNIAERHATNQPDIETRPIHSPLLIPLPYLRIVLRLSWPGRHCRAWAAVCRERSSHRR